jgi:hypothetical protein
VLQYMRAQDGVEAAVCEGEVPCVGVHLDVGVLIDVQSHSVKEWGR